MFIQDMVHDLAISPFSRGLLYGNIGVVDHALDDGTVLHENTDVLFLRLTRLTLDLEDRDHLIVQVFAISDRLVLHECLLNDVIGGEDVLVGEEYQVLVHQEIIIRLLHVPVLQAIQVESLFFGYIWLHHGVIEVCTLFFLERNDNDMIFDERGSSLQDDLIEIQVNLFVMVLNTLWCV